jgi:hypothetical protein
MAQFVTARAVRDGLYLTNLADSTLPAMMLSASLATAVKAKAMGMAQMYVTGRGWEPEARTRAANAVTAIRATIQ